MTEKLTWLSANILTRSPETLIANTNSRFDGINARHLLAELQSQRPQLKNDPVFGHYDFCLPNVLAQNSQVTAIIDWSGAGYFFEGLHALTCAFWQ